MCCKIWVWEPTSNHSKRRMQMKLTPPKAITFWISIVLGLLGLLSQIGILAVLPIAAFWLLFIGFVLLVLALLIKGL